MTEQELETLKQIRDMLTRIIDSNAQQPFKSEVGKKFSERMKELEKKNATAIEKII